MSLLRGRDFRLLLAGQVTGQFGTQISGVAVPLLAVGILHATPFEIGVLGAASTIAFLLIGLPAGAWLDRVRRRPVLVASELVRMLLFLAVPALAWAGMLTMTHLVVIVLLAGFARVLFDIGYQSYLPGLIGRGQVLAGNSTLEFARASGQIAGPGLGGLLVSLLGAANVLLVQAATFLVSAVTLLGIRRPEPAPLPRETRGGYGADIAEGLRFVLATRVLRATVVASALSNLSFAIASAVTVIFLVRTLELPAWGVGLVIALGAGAAMLGAAVTPRVSSAVGSARIIWLSLVVTAPFTLLGALAQPGPLVLLVVVGMAVGELGQIVYAITNVSLRQRLTPERILGRVNATVRVLIMGLFPLGALVGGAVGELIGPRLTLVVAGVVGIIAPLQLFLALRHRRDVDDLPEWG